MQSVEITKIIEWDMGHRVPNHKNLCKNLHGHRYRLELTIRGPVQTGYGDSSEGMVLDFSDVKSILKEHIHDHLDHCFMHSDKDSILVPFAKAQENELRFISVPFIPTAENIVIYCYERLKKYFNQTIEISRLRLYETPNSWADYTPLKNTNIRRCF